MDVKLRESQTPPDGDWFIWFYACGRGGGKSYAGSKWVHRLAFENPGCRIGLLGRTQADIRDVMVTGESGLLRTGFKGFDIKYQPSQGLITWPNESKAYLHSANNINSLRGSTFDFAWADEPYWVHQRENEMELTALQNLYLATRGRKDSRVLVTGTPPIEQTTVEELLGYEASKNIAITHGTTAENSENLNVRYLDTMRNLYGGTKLEYSQLNGRI